MESEEIYLKDYFKILFERKLLVGVIFFIALVSGAIFSFLSPKIYEVDVWLEIGKAKNVLVEEPAQIIRKIKEGIYGEFKDGEMEAIVANKTNLIRVKIKTENPKKAEEFLNDLSSRILLEHNEIINKERKFIKERIKKNEEEIVKAEEEIKLWKDIKKRAIFESKDSIYQLMSLFVESSIEGKGSVIENRKKGIEDLELSFNYNIDTKIAKEPSVFLPSQTKKFALNVAIFGLSGLFIGILLVFWRKW